MCRTGKAGLELVTQGGQFQQVGIKGKRLTELCLVVAQLGFGNGDVLPHMVAFRAVGGGQAFQDVQDSTRPLVLPRQHGLSRNGSFQVHVGRELWMKDHAESQAPVDADRNAGRLADVVGHGIQLGGEARGCVLA